jgi:hypothetical protein
MGINWFQGRSGVVIPPFLTMAIDEVSGQLQAPVALLPREKSPGIH